MDQNTITLIIGISGIVATLLSSFAGLYFTSKTRINPFRELLYTKQLELLHKILHKQGRIKTYLPIIVDSDSPHKDSARNDIGISVKEHSELVDEGAALLPTDLWIEIKRLNNKIIFFLVDWDVDNLNNDTSFLKAYSSIDTKIALLSRTLIGVDKLSEDSLELYSNLKDFERIAKIESNEFRKS